MKFLFSPRRTRFTAAVMLFVWLLTLGAGIANACLLHEGHPHMDPGVGAVAHGTRDAAPGVYAHNVAPAAATSAVLTGDGEPLIESIVCLELCVAAQTVARKPEAAACGVHHVGPVLVASCGSVKARVAALPTPYGGASLPRPEPPVYIRFLRLTL